MKSTIRATYNAYLEKSRIRGRGTVSSQVYWARNLETAVANPRQVFLPDSNKTWPVTEIKRASEEI